ncbi:MAG: hypothetical protein GXP04_15225 [Alphaproteobacteria bacterium]|nr:hypothetical protein [Alphaproteobacteria bacterium]
MGKSTGVNLISGLIKKRAEVAGQHRAALKIADAIKDDLTSIDRTLVLCGYEGDPSGIEPRSKYKQLFGRSELKRLVLACLKDGSQDDEAVLDYVIQAKSWELDKHGRKDLLNRTRNALQRLRNAGTIDMDYGPGGNLWTLKQRPAEYNQPTDG